MTTMTITVPESPSVPATDLIAGAARRAGHTAEHRLTPEQFLAEYLAEHLHQLYRSARVDETLVTVEEEVPAPTRTRTEAEPVVEEQSGTTEPTRLR